MDGAAGEYGRMCDVEQHVAANSQVADFSQPPSRLRLPVQLNEMLLPDESAMSPEQFVLARLMCALAWLVNGRQTSKQDNTDRRNISTLLYMRHCSVIGCAPTLDDALVKRRLVHGDGGII
ncbi:conserved hypothetical protein [Ricinus communis]|uniref:Uncharacterized protein n=1 Tax=Ricinus communis TaxID=3988 RepID=B9TC93_RICCO|nr:conserved hypothetical protein [Ricinus communis]